MRTLESIIGIVLALGIMAVSAVINARYGMSLAKPGFDQTLMMAVAVFVDATKAVSWIYFAGAVARRQVMAATSSLLIFLCCFTYAVSGALGYIAMNRAQSSATVESHGETAASIKSELGRKEKSLAALGSVSPPAVVAKQVEAKKQDKRYTTTLQCGYIPADSTKASDTARTFCIELAQLEAEQKKAEAAAILEDDLTDLRKQRDAAGGVATADKGDFQSALITQLITNFATVQLSTVQMSLSLLFVIVVESGACFLLWLSLNHAAKPVKPHAPSLPDTPPTLPTVLPSPPLAAVKLLAQPTNPKAPALTGPSPAPRPPTSPVVTGHSQSAPVTPPVTPLATVKASTKAVPKSPAPTSAASAPLATPAAPATPAAIAPPADTQTRSSKIGDLVDFIDSCLDLNSGPGTDVGEIASTYKRWCLRSGVQPVSDEALVTGLTQFCEAGQIPQVRKQGKIYLRGVVITPDAHEKRAR